MSVNYDVCKWMATIMIERWRNCTVFSFFLTSLKKLVLLSLIHWSLKNFRCLAISNLMLSFKNWILNFLWHCSCKQGTPENGRQIIEYQKLQMFIGQGVLFSYYCLTLATISIRYIFNLAKRKSHGKKIVDHAIAYCVFRAELHRYFLCCTHN